MRKIIISSYDDINNPHYGGGGALAVHEIAKRLSKEFDIVVYTGRYPKCQNETLDGVKYKRIGISFLGPKLGQLFFQFLLPFYAFFLKYDLWVESFTPPFSTAFLPLFTRQPVIGLAHMLAAADSTRKYKLPFYLVENFGLQFYEYLIVMQGNDKKKVKQVNPKVRVYIIPNGIEPPARGVDLIKEKKYITFIGRVEIEQKGLDLLIKAFASIAQEVGYKLMIAGSGSRREENRLIKLIESYNLAGKVVLAGRVEGAQKKDIYEKTLVAAVPSRFETFGFAALESLAYGLPLVTFDIEGLKWVPKSVSLKVESENAENFGAAMALAIKDEKLRKNLSHLGRKFAEQFSWERAVEGYKTVFSAALKQTELRLGTKEKTQGNKLVERIISSRTPCIFISPHLDDAMLSAGDLISVLSEQCEVTLVTVFTAAGLKPYSYSAKRFLKLHGYENAESMYEDRIREDRQICSRLNIKAEHLGFTDALWRKKMNIESMISSLFGRMFPEFFLLYPTYRWHVAAGKLHKQDQELKKEVVARLKRMFPQAKECTVFCPAGFGGHVDHVLVRQACQEVFSSPIFWKDATYRVTNKDRKMMGLYNTVSWQKESEKKLKLLEIYQSQIPVMFKAGKVPDNFETYYVPKK